MWGWGTVIEYQNDYLEQVEKVKPDFYFYITRVYSGYLFIFFYLWTMWLY